MASAHGYQFEFHRRVFIDDAKKTLTLARIAMEGLFGAATVRLDFRHLIDIPRRRIVVDGATDVGRAVTKVFTEFLLHLFGEEEFRVSRVDMGPASRNPLTTSSPDRR